METDSDRSAAAGRIVRAVILVGAPLCLVLFGCFFDPRTPQESGSTVPVSEPAKTPEEVTAKLVSSYLKFYRAQYELLLADAFRFVPDRADSTELADAGYTPFADPWDVAREEDVFSRISSCFNDNTTKIGAMELVFTGEQTWTDSAVTGYSTFETDYDLDIQYATLTVPSREDSVSLGGSMRLFVRYETADGSYRIYRWEDFRKGAFRSWGYFKGEVAASLSYCPE